MHDLDVAGVVAELEAIAASGHPADTTDVTDRVDVVEARVRTRVIDDAAYRRGVLAALSTHPDAQVRSWLAGMVVPSAWLAVAEPERLFGQPGVPVTAERTPAKAALSLGARSEDHLGLLGRRRARSRPWSQGSAEWRFGGWWPPTA